MICNITFNGPDPANPANQGLPIVVTIPPALMMTAITALCAVTGYQPTIPDPNNPGSMMANPIGPATVAVQQTVNYWKSTILAYALAQDQAAAVNPNQAAAQAGLAQVTITQS